MTISIYAKKREGKPEEVRTAGLIPAVLYGPEIEPQSIMVEKNAFEKAYESAGESTLIDFSIDGGEATKVLIQDMQKHPVKHNIIHIDFRQIKMGEEMTVTIPLEFIGEAMAVKQLGGTLVTPLEYVNAKCLPKDLISSIEVSLDVLKTFSDRISVSDLKLPAGITITDNLDTAVAIVNAPLSDDQLKAMEEENTKGVDAIEVEEKVKEPAGGEEVKKKDSDKK